MNLSAYCKKIRIIKTVIMAGALSIMFSVHSNGVFPRPHDIFFRPPVKKNSFMQFYTWNAFSVKSVTFDDNSSVSNVLWYQNRTQDGLAMLNGFSPGSEIGQKRAQLPVVDDGTRGHFSAVANHYSPLNMSFGWRVFFSNDITFGAYLPLAAVELKDSKWESLTQMNNAQDAQVNKVLVPNFAECVNKLGQGLDLGNWKRLGVGNLELFVEYMRNFPQAKQMLKNVLLDLRFGVALPTGLKGDYDKLVAFPFSYNGSTALVYGGGIEMLYGYFFIAGIDVELIHIFGNTEQRRIKTAENQTDLLLLEKNPAYIDWGMQQQFTLWLGLDKFYKNISFKFGYRLLKQGDSRLALEAQPSSTEIANTAMYLENWTLHDVLMKLSYEFTSDENPISSSTSIFARIPFEGKNSTAFQQVGLMAKLSF